MAEPPDPRAAPSPRRPGRGRSRLAFALGGVSALAAVAAGGLGFIASGLFDVAGTRPHDPLTYWATRSTMEASVRRHARAVTAPDRFTAEQAAAGFRIYDAQCVQCHGAPGFDARARWTDGLNPTPPYLLDSPEAWSRGELYWIIKHGLKMTGMPAWTQVCRDDEIWSLVAFLEAMPRLDSQGYARLRAEQAAARAPVGCGAGPPG